MKRWIVVLIMLGIGFATINVLDRGEHSSTALPPGPTPVASPIPSPALSTVASPLPSSAPVKDDPAELERARAERAAHARQIVSSLSQVNAKANELTPEQAETRRLGLLALLADGKEAVPPIAEFLQTHTNPALRLDLIKVLFDLPGPDNVNLQVQVLKVTIDPEEVALLARQLEEQEPGKHGEAIAAARLRAGVK